MLGHATPACWVGEEDPSGSLDSKSVLRIGVLPFRWCAAAEPMSVPQNREQAGVYQEQHH
jgi:hypothetical protein